MGKKILLIPNMPNWSLDKNAKDLIKYNPSDLELKIAYFGDFIKNYEKYYAEFDLIFPMTVRLFFEFLIRGIPIDKVITGIRSYASWDKGKTKPPGLDVKVPKKFIKNLKKALLVNTNCKKLWHIFSKQLQIVYTKYTCDLEIFYPEKKKQKNKKLVVGWTGSLTNNDNDKTRYRGVLDIIKPVCDSYENIELKVQYSEKEWIIDDNRMREFYNSLDLYICASGSESGPRPILESAACGIPSLTTDVGLVPELIENNTNGFIVERNINSFIKKLDYCINNREELTNMGELIRKKMEKEFQWENLIPQWIDFFERSLELYQLKKKIIENLSL